MSSQPRRSQRTPKPRAIFEERSYRVEKKTYITRSHKTQTITRHQSTLRKSLDHEIPRTPSQKSVKISKPSNHKSQLIADSASEESEEEISTTDEEDSSSDVSADDFQETAADDLDRRESYDSRYESGNEEYELDEFVVEDEYLSSDEGSEAGSDITLVEGEDDEYDRRDEESHVERKASTSSTSSRASESLFVEEMKDPTEEREEYPTSMESSSKSPILEYEPYMEIPVNEHVPEDVAEDIMDAISLFARRCNRQRAPLRLRLSRATLEDSEVSDALNYARTLGLSRRRDLGDGTEWWCIGPHV